MKSNKKNSIDEILTELERKVKSDPEKYIFDPGTTIKEIEEFELITGIELPLSYRKFLLKFNGGFICPDYFKGNIESFEKLDTAKWNSITIFSLRELYAKYQDLDSWSWKLFNDWRGVYPIVPVARAENNELLVIINPLKNGESPVFDAFHEDPFYDWGILSNDFAEFLESYLNSDGRLSTISYTKETAESYIPETGWKFVPNDSFSDEDYLKFFSIKLEMDPDDMITLCDCSRYYLDKQDFKSALFYAGKAIVSSPENDWSYYHRSLVYKKMGKFDLALKDILRVNTINPDRALYLAETSSIYIELEEYEKAKEYAEKAIEDNPTYSYAYLLMERIYIKTGDLEMAEKYSDLADDFMDD